MSIYSENLMMPKRRIMMFSVERTNIVCSIVTQLWCAGPLCLLNPKLPDEKHNCTRDDEQFAQHRAARSEARCGSYTDHFSGIECWNHDKSTPYRSETNGIAENAVRRCQRRYLCSSGSVGSFRKAVEKRWNASVVCETYKTNWQTESHRMKQDLELHVMVQCYHLGLNFIPIQSLPKIKVVFIDVVQRCFQDFIGYALNSEKSLDRRLDHRGLARHREQRRVRSLRQEIQVQRNRNRETAGCINIFFAQVVP